MKCGICKSENIYHKEDVGFDIDESGETKQHLNICNDCGAYSLESFCVFFDGRKPKTFFSKWYEKDDFINTII